MSVIEKLHRLLCCPDDGGALRLEPHRLVCGACGRAFPAEDDFVSLVPRSPYPVAENSAYRRFYLEALAENDHGDAGVPGWSIPPLGPPRLFARKRRQVACVQRLLLEGDTSRELVCDFSAGPGYYTLACARAWRLVVHGDLCVSSLRGARARARREGLDNILFVRMDYLRPPFRHSLPRILCLDSLERGWGHECALLRAIAGALAGGGTAVVDFHNWWHNPLRRLGLLPNNFGPNRSYNRRELAQVLAGAGIARPECFPFHQEADPGSAWGRLIARCLPPTRWIFRFRNVAEAHSHCA